MENKLPLRMVGIIAGAAAVFAFVFGMIVSLGIPALGNRSEASAESPGGAPLVNAEGESPFVRVAELVSPAVVNISAEHTAAGGPMDEEWNFGGPFDDFFRDFFKNFPRPESRTRTLGSGFVISSDGYIVTNYHVVKDASKIIVRLVDKSEYKGEEVKVVGVDSRTDLALLKIQAGSDLPFLTLGDSEKIKPGDWAIAVGNPFNLEGSVTVGVISAKGRSNIALPEGPDFQSFLQTDAAINPGNSGGPLVNVRGEVIGINTAITSPSGGNIGIGFAIPVNMAKSVIAELKDKGKVTRGYLGIYLQDVTKDLKDALGLPAMTGVLVSEVLDNTPASRAGLKSGDVILSLDGKKVEDVQAFRFSVASLEVGKTIVLKIFRDGKEKDISVKIGEMQQDAGVQAEGEPEPELGLTVASVNDPRAKRFDLKAESGVVVIAVKAGSPAQDVDIRAGDIIVQIGKQEIKNLDDYRRSIAGMKKGKSTVFQVVRGGRKSFVAVTP